jgi:hypothetical protein
MQTFLPYSNFKKCAEVLDYRRLGKQRVEGMQIINCLIKPNKWSNHPAVKMWQGYEMAIKSYVNTMIHEWIRQGYKNTMQIYEIDDWFYLPSWLGDHRLHSSHRANLIRKDPKYYGQFGWTEDPVEEYWWPYRRKEGKWVCYM